MLSDDINTEQLKPGDVVKFKSRCDNRWLTGIIQSVRVLEGKTEYHVTIRRDEIITWSYWLWHEQVQLVPIQLELALSVRSSELLEL